MRSIRILPIALLLVFILLIDFYAFQALGPIISKFGKSSQELVSAAYWGITGFILFSLLFTLKAALKVGKLTNALKNCINTVLVNFVTKLVFVLSIFIQDIIRVLASVFNAGVLPARNDIAIFVGLGLAFLIFLAFLHGVTLGKYNYKVHKLNLHFDDLPEAFDDFKLVQISDVHAGSFDNARAVEKGIRLINDQEPDLFVFTGDLVNNQSEEILPWIEKFGRIKAKYGKYSILGNHDYGDYIQWSSHHEKAMNLEHLKIYHSNMGFELLLDQHALIKKDGQEIALLGVENWGLGFGQRGDIKKALSGVNPDAFKVLLSHDPTHWQSIIKELPVKIDLTLSGHTHGMQFGIEALGIKWSPVKYRYKHWAGLTEYKSRYLYINRGFGFLGFSGRVGIWPEITVITLKKSYA
ncbi:metallophosphoesterase [Desertivirga arenae]|uniref:metallophosphoesterase n=1 Tax=Desertivirga arenae TaxID=2810309 RepID=UPI001A95DF03|nr:metallophosphoesterase [Pedobacter sp. SYSU D00823]